MGYDADGKCQFLVSFLQNLCCESFASVMRANPSPTITSSTSVFG